MSWKKFTVVFLTISVFIGATYCVYVYSSMSSFDKAVLQNSLLMKNCGTHEFGVGIFTSGPKKELKEASENCIREAARECKSAYYVRQIVSGEWGFSVSDNIIETSKDCAVKIRIWKYTPQKTYTISDFDPSIWN